MMGFTSPCQNLHKNGAYLAKIWAYRKLISYKWQNKHRPICNGVSNNENSDKLKTVL